MESGTSLQEYTVQRLRCRGTFFLVWYIVLAFLFLLFISIFNAEVISSNECALEDFAVIVGGLVGFILIPAIFVLGLGTFLFIKPLKKRISAKFMVDPDAYAVSPASLEKTERDHILGYHYLSTISLIVLWLLQIGSFIFYSSDKLYIFDTPQLEEDATIYTNFTWIFFLMCFLCFLISGFLLVCFLSDKSDLIIRKSENININRLLKKITFSFHTYTVIPVLILIFSICSFIFICYFFDGESFKPFAGTGFTTTNNIFEREWFDVGPVWYRGVFAVACYLICTLVTLSVGSIDDVICTVLGKKPFSKVMVGCILLLSVFGVFTYSVNAYKTSAMSICAPTKITSLGVHFAADSDGDKGLFYMADDKKAQLVYGANDFINYWEIYREWDEQYGSHTTNNRCTYAHYEIPVDRTLSKEESLKKLQTEYTALQDSLKYTNCSILVKKDIELPSNFVDTFLNTSGWDIVPDDNNKDDPFGSAITNFITYEQEIEDGVHVSVAYIEYKKNGKYRYYADRYSDVLVVNVEKGETHHICYYDDEMIRNNSCLSYDVFVNSSDDEKVRHNSVPSSWLYVLEEDDGVSNVSYDDDSGTADFCILLDRTLSKEESLAEVKRKYSELSKACDVPEHEFPKEFTEWFLSETWAETVANSSSQSFVTEGEPSGPFKSFAYRNRENGNYYGIGLNNLDYLEFSVNK